MQSLLSYGSDDEDEEDQDDQRAAPTPLAPSSSHSLPIPTTHTLSASSLSSSLPAPTAASTSTSRASASSVLSSLAASLSSLNSSSSPFSTSLFDPALDAAVAPPTAAPSSTPPPAPLPIAPAPPSSSVAVSSRPKMRLPSAASLLARLPDDADGWKERTADSSDSNTVPAIDRKQFKAMPMPDSLRVGASDNDRFRFSAASLSQSLAGDGRQPPPQPPAAADESREEDEVAEPKATESTLPVRPSPRSNGQGRHYTTAQTFLATVTASLTSARLLPLLLLSFAVVAVPRFAPPQLGRKRANVSTEDIGSVSRSPVHHSIRSLHPLTHILTLSPPSSLNIPPV